MASSTTSRGSLTRAVAVTCHRLISCSAFGVVDRGAASHSTSFVELPPLAGAGWSPRCSARDGGIENAEHLEVRREVRTIEGVMIGFSAARFTVTAYTLQSRTASASEARGSRTGTNSSRRTL